MDGVFKQCSCRDQEGKRFYRRCSRLAERVHGRWYFRCYVRDLWDKPVQVTRGGFSSQTAAVRARAELVAQSREQFAGRTWTVARWLRYGRHRGPGCQVCARGGRPAGQLQQVHIKHSAAKDRSWREASGSGCAHRRWFPGPSP